MSVCHRSMNNVRLNTGSKLSPGSFTLIELMVALAIMTSVIGVVVAAFAGGLRVWDAAAGFNRVEVEALPGLSIIQKDLMNAIPFYGIEFRGENRKLAFAVVESRLGEGGIQTPRIVEVQYRFDAQDGELVRESTSFPGRVDNFNNEEESIVAGVNQVRFSYMDVDEDMTEEWQGVWQSYSNLPFAVDVELWFSDSDPVYRRRIVRGRHGQ